MGAARGNFPHISIKLHKQHATALWTAASLRCTKRPPVRPPSLAPGGRSRRVHPGPISRERRRQKRTSCPPLRKRVIISHVENCSAARQQHHTENRKEGSFSGPLRYIFLTKSSATVVFRIRRRITWQNVNHLGAEHRSARSLRGSYNVAKQLALAMPCSKNNARVSHMGTHQRGLGSQKHPQEARLRVFAWYMHKQSH